MVSIWLTLLNSCIFGYRIMRNLTVVSLIFHVLLDLIHCALNVLSVNILNYYGVDRSSHWYLLIKLMSLCQLGCHSAIPYMYYKCFCFVRFGSERSWLVNRQILLIIGVCSGILYPWGLDTVKVVGFAVVC